MTTVPASLQADHVAIRVPELENAIQWYEQMLGFSVVTRWHDATDLDAAYLELNGFWLELLAGGSPQQPITTPANINEDLQVQGYRHLCFRTDDVDRVITQLQQHGVRVLMAPKDNPPIKRRTALILDNNDNAIEFAQPLD